MFRKSVISGAATLAIGVLALGCSDDDSSSKTALQIFSSYPGSPVQNNITSFDGIAWSQDAADAEASSVSCYTDTNSARSILVYLDDDDDLWVSYGSGSGNFTPTTNVTFARQEDVRDVVGVAFLNTSGNADQVARARNGDAIILFRAEQSADPSSNNDDQTTVGLFSCYMRGQLTNQDQAFLVDDSANLVEFRNGFQVVASRVDGDPDSSNSVGTKDVRWNAGLISDSLEGNNGPGGTRRAFSSGNSTTYVYALWQQSTSDTANREYRYKRFPLTTADAVAFGSGTGTTITPTVIDVSTGGDDEEVEQIWLSHNGYFLTLGFDGGAGDTNDEFLWVNIFGATSVSSEAQINRTDANSAIRLESGWSLYEQVLGPDDGLGHLFGVYRESGFNANVTGANADNNLFGFTVVNNNGTPDASRSMIDAFGDVGSDTANVLTADVNDVQIGLSRDASWVGIAFTQYHTDDADASTNDHDVVKFRAYDTSLEADATGPAAFSNLLVLTDEIGGTNTGGAYSMEFQGELGWKCGVQSDVTRMTVGFCQSTGTNTISQILINTVEASLAVGTTDPAVTSVTSGDVVVVDQDDDWGSFGNGDFEIADYGTDGLPIVVFMAQANNADSDSVTTSFYERRLFAHLQGVTAADVDTTNDANVISTQGATLDEQQVDEIYFVGTTPRSMSLSTNNPNFAGTNLHILFEQQQFGTASFWNDDLMVVSLDKRTLNGTEATLVSYLGVNVNVQGAGAAVNGNSLDVYFEQGRHIHYNSVAFGKVGTPTLIDNRYEAEIDDVHICFDEDGTSSSCDDGPGAIVLWSKEPDNNGRERVLLRQR